MEEIVNSRMERNRSSSQVTPVLVYDEPHKVIDVPKVKSQTASGSDPFEFSTERIPEDAWLPITESRKGNTFTSTLHLLCSGIGFQVFMLPFAFVSLGWRWGIVSLTLAYAWQLYTAWLLVHLHESSPLSGIRYSRFPHLSIVAFGETLGKLLAIFPTVYLSSGICALYINTGGRALQRMYDIMCDGDLECRVNTLKGFEWFLIFICAAIFIALFFPNLNSLSPVTLIGSITGIAFCTVIWILSVSYSNNASIPDRPNTTGNARFRDVMNAVATIFTAFRGHNIMLEIQGTIPINAKERSVKPMWRAVTISYLIIAACMYPLAIVGHWDYGDAVTMNGGVLSSFAIFHRNQISKYVVAAVYLMVIINYLCTFQIYAMVTFDNIERLYVSKKNEQCPRWVRSVIKVSYGGLIYFVAVGLPFMPRIATLMGSIALPLTLVYPCFMWLLIKKPSRYSGIWCLNIGLGVLGTVLSIVIFIAAVSILVVRHFEAHFFNP